MSQLPFRIGHGYDVHRLVEGRDLILGGVKIPHETGLLGHSDADVLSHAIADSLLGAAGKKDIGFHFPDTNPMYRGISSLLLLEKVMQILVEDGYRIGNIDSTIAMQRPKLRPHIDQMRANIAASVGVDVECVSVKATTTEHLGFEGEEKGVSATAVVLIYKE